MGSPGGGLVTRKIKKNLPARRASKKTLKRVSITDYNIFHSSAVNEAIQVFVKEHRLMSLPLYFITCKKKFSY
jgi:hypothetical protein